MAGFVYQSIHKYLVNAVCNSPLHIGSASGNQGEFLVHPVNSLPFIQASSIAGVLRSVCDRVNGKEVSAQLFGTSRTESVGSGESGSRLNISDGVFSLESVFMELRPRVAINPKTGSVKSEQIAGSGKFAGHKFEMESIAAGAKFSFSIYLFDDNLKSAVDKVLFELNSNHIQIGGQKSNGAGYLAVNSIRYICFDMNQEKGRLDWGNEARLPGDDWTPQLTTEASAMAFTITAKGRTEGALLVKGIAVTKYGEEAPDAMNIQSAAGAYIVPGSSLKGALKAQSIAIAKRLGVENMIESVYGSTGTKDTKGKAGCISILDTVVGEKDKNDNAPIQHRIHIDKFTSGVFSQGLFLEKNVFGEMTITINITDKGDEKVTKAAAGLMLLTLRDLASGLINVGSGYSVGKGFIEIDSIEIKSYHDDALATIDVAKGCICDSKDVIHVCLKALSEVQEVR